MRYSVTFIHVGEVPSSILCGDAPLGVIREMIRGMKFELELPRYAVIQDDQGVVVQVIDWEEVNADVRGI